MSKSNSNEITVYQAVEQIPLNPKAKANAQVKEYIGNIIRNIASRKQTIQNEKNRNEQRSLLESYRSSVRFSDKIKKLQEAKAEKEKVETKVQKLKEEFNKKVEDLRSVASKAVEKVHDELIEIGLSTDGELLAPRQKAAYDSRGDYIGEKWHIDKKIVSDKTVKRINEIKDLIAAVGLSNIAITDDQVLNIRLMAATTVGECIAIVNAVAGEDMFSMGAIPGEPTLPALKDAA